MPEEHRAERDVGHETLEDAGESVVELDYERYFLLIFSGEILNEDCLFHNCLVLGDRLGGKYALSEHGLVDNRSQRDLSTQHHNVIFEQQ